MSTVLKQSLEKRKRFTVVGIAGQPTVAVVNHVLAASVNAAQNVAAEANASTAGYRVLTVFPGYQSEA